MATTAEYLEFLKSRGRPLKEINPGSDEAALSHEDALRAIELLKTVEAPILGGDVLSVDDSGELMYAYQTWGFEYHALSWYCTQHDGESHTEYCNRSYHLAEESILLAAEISKQLRRVCYIVLVI